MKRNFDFLKDKHDFADLYAYCNMAEVNQKSDPEKSAINARRALEYTIKSIYLLRGIDIPERGSLFELVNNEYFVAFIDDAQLMMALHYIRKVGNNAAHMGKVAPKESFFAVLNLHTFVAAVLEKLSVTSDVPPFDKALLDEAKPSASVSIAPAQDAQPQETVIKKYRPRIKKHDTLNAKNPQYFSEDETRRFYIDQQLREAGWEVLDKKNLMQPAKACIEIKVEGMPNTISMGAVDYVLFGRNGIPLAVVEAKKTSANVQRGRHQATLYADCLEKQYGIRPVIYYTNGYEIYIIDDLGYPSRQLLGFHTLSDLELIIQRKRRSKITDLNIKDTITNRAYQKQAITAVCEHFNKMHRRALLVMATGTGKTRVSISLVELMMRNNWVKNVLFLADRTALVKQAHKNYTKLLTSVTTCVLSDNSEKDMNARIMFSTYQTMINYIDSDVKDFSVGRFDLVIIDEAHRSIFGRYGAIFEYFDSLVVGLTATPRDEIDRSTYQIFEMEQGVPNFSYELEEAVDDKYLVPYRGIKRLTNHLRSGIRYKDLSADEREQLEKVWDYEATNKVVDGEEYHRDISNKEMFKYIFNEDTIDKVLQDLMEKGLKVQSGERIGKTIIFAYNRQHAELIVNRFKKLYPEYGDSFCVQIDYSITYAHNLIERLEIRDKDPQIAVSVDMLDTGIDIPDLLNLVFFKEIRSKIKFMQMIGRGTRLSEDIFGVDKHKEEFYIFDWCENFDFFELNPNGIDTKPTQSLTDKIFCLKAEIAQQLQSATYQEDEFAKQYHDSLKENLRNQILGLNPSHINVRKNNIFVDKYKLESSWVYLSLVDLAELKSKIAPIITSGKDDENAKKFDLLVLNIELGLLIGKNANQSRNAVISAARALQERITIPQIAEKLAVIKEVLTDKFWQNITLERLEYIRIEIRELLKFLTGEITKTFSVDIEDSIIYNGETDVIFTIRTYKQKVIDYLAENSDNRVVQKIKNLEKLTQRDILELEKILWKELGTKEEYNKYASKLSSGNVAVFIRSIVGVDRNVAVERFSQFLSDNELNSEQQEYLKTIINYVCENGDITKEILVNESPFVGYDWMKIFGDNVGYIPQYIDVIHNVVVA